MKASELIKKLNTLIEQNGDKEIKVVGNAFFDTYCDFTIYDYSAYYDKSLNGEPVLDYYFIDFEESEEE